MEVGGRVERRETPERAVAKPVLRLLDHGRKKVRAAPLRSGETKLKEGDESVCRSHLAWIDDRA